jgi:hypothetical protein
MPPLKLEADVAHGAGGILERPQPMRTVSTHVMALTPQKDPNAAIAVTRILRSQAFHRLHSREASRPAHETCPIVLPSRAVPVMMSMHEHNKTRCCKRLGKALDAVLLGPGKGVSHGDGLACHRSFR